jgi:hypothetical protein
LDSEYPPLMQTPAPSTSPPFRRFAALGDGLSSAAESDSGVPWPEQAARALAGDGVEPAVRNVAVAGATSVDVAIWQLRRAVEFRPDLISLICGANDVLLSAPPEPEVFTAVFDGIVDSLRRRLPGALIVTATYPRAESGIAAINVAIRETAARRDLVCLEWAGDPSVDHPRSFAEAVRTAAADGRAGSR